MARKKNTSPKKDGANAKASSSKASAISGVVKDAEFDELDAAMADTKVEGVTLDDLEADKVAPEDVKEDVAETVEPVDEPEAELDEADAKPEDVAAPEAAPEPVQTIVERRGGFWAPLFGGALAALIGFGGAIYFKAADWPVFGGTNAVETQLDAQSKMITDLQAALEATQAEASEARAALSARLDELPAQDVAPLPADVQAKLDAQRAEMDELEASLDKMRALTQGQIATAQEQQENAALAEAKAKARGAVNALRSALETGAPYGSVLPEIAAAVEVPEILSANAETGITTASALQTQFAEGARAALSASLKANAGDSTADRLSFFLKDQLGARSLTPREGDDPDAVLSRAEASVKAGDLDAALTTIEALPDAGKAELEAWAGVAETRRDALAAFDGLSDAISAN